MAFDPVPTGYLSVSEITRRLGVSRQTLYRWLDAGLPSHQPGGPKGRRLFVPVEVDSWVRARCTSNAPDRKAAG